MNKALFDQYRHMLEQRFFERGHNSLSHHFIPDLAQAFFNSFHRRAIQSLSAYLPFNQQLSGNPYLMQGGGDYHILEMNFGHGPKVIIHTYHIYEHTGTLPMSQKHGRLVDLMIRLNYLKTLPEFANAQTYMVLVSDHVMINYKNGFIFEQKHITPVWVTDQVNAFQRAIIPKFKDHLQETGLITAIHYTPVYTNPSGNFGMGVWQIS